MSERADGDLLRDIREAVRRIQTYTHAMTYDRFLSDIKTQDAVVRNLEIMGEATKGLTTELREKYPHVPWRGMAGVRDRLIHHYITPRGSAAAQLRERIIDELKAAGLVEDLPWTPPPAVSESERARLATMLGKGKPLSKIIIEERENHA